jgi:uncharacterized protein YbjT (DUF2867 family)
MILVVGSTGELGRRVVQRLRGCGEEVTCLVRPHSDDGQLRALGARTARGDLTDPASLPAACADADTVISTATAIGRLLSGNGGPSITEVDEIGTASLVASAEAAGVGRFVYISYAGADAGLGSPLERAKVATEQLLRASPMRETLVRPDAFQEIHLGPLGRFDMVAGKVAVFGKGDTPRRWVSTDDVAALIAHVAVDPGAPGLIEFGGPEAMSRNEAIAVAERLTGRAMKRQAMPRFAARLGMRVMNRPNQALASIFGAGLLQDLFEPHWDDAPLRERGITPRSATEFLEEQVRVLGLGG